MKKHLKKVRLGFEPNNAKGQFQINSMSYGAHS